jgi:predicted nucleic acid-binding Zn ribbon protein
MNFEKLCPHCKNKIAISYCLACGEPFAHFPEDDIETCSEECKKLLERLR